MKFVDLSHSVFDGLITYKGLPAPVICDFMSREGSAKNYDDGSTFQIGRIDMVSNTGTYLDCPFHRYENGRDLSELRLEEMANLKAIVIRAQGEMEIDKVHFEGKDVTGKAILVHTGWAMHWNTEQYFENHPYLTAEAALYLKEMGAALVGIDSHNIDDTRGRSRPVHTTLLGADILIVEHMTNLGALPDDGFVFSAVPPKIEGMGTFPVRAFATLDL